MKRGFWWRKQGPSPLFPRQTRVRIRGAAMGGIILFGNAPRYPLPLLLPHGGSRLGSDGERANGGLKAPAAGTVCLQTRAVARRRFQPFGRRHRNRSGGFCCFSTPKSREREKSFFLVLLGPKVPKASARRFPRESTARGAARGAQDQAYAPPRDGRVAARTLFFRVKRECGFVVPPRAAKDIDNTNSGLRQRATPLPRSPATRGDAQRSGRHTNTPARCAAPVCGSPPVRPA